MLKITNVEGEIFFIVTPLEFYFTTSIEKNGDVNYMVRTESNGIFYVRKDEYDRLIEVAEGLLEKSQTKE